MKITDRVSFITFCWVSYIRSFRQQNYCLFLFVLTTDSSWGLLWARWIGLPHGGPYHQVRDPRSQVQTTGSGCVTHRRRNFIFTLKSSMLRFKDLKITANYKMTMTDSLLAWQHHRPTSLSLVVVFLFLKQKILTRHRAVHKVVWPDNQGQASVRTDVPE